MDAERKPTHHAKQTSRFPGLARVLRLAGWWTQKWQGGLGSVLLQLQALWQLLQSMDTLACLVRFCWVPQKQHGAGPVEAHRCVFRQKQEHVLPKNVIAFYSMHRSPPRHLDPSLCFHHSGLDRLGFQSAACVRASARHTKCSWSDCQMRQGPTICMKSDYQQIPKAYLAALLAAKQGNRSRLLQFMSAQRSGPSHPGIRDRSVEKGCTLLSSTAIPLRTASLQASLATRPIASRPVAYTLRA